MLRHKQNLALASNRKQWQFRAFYSQMRWVVGICAFKVASVHQHFVNQGSLYLTEETLAACFISHRMNSANRHRSHRDCWRQPLTEKEEEVAANWPVWIAARHRAWRCVMRIEWWRRRGMTWFSDKKIWILFNICDIYSLIWM